MESDIMPSYIPSSYLEGICVKGIAKKEMIS